MKDRIMVTGGLGFIGSHFVQLALDRGYHVVNVDKQTYASRADVSFLDHPSYEWIKEDICTLSYIPSNVQWIVNFAAESHVGNSILENDVFLRSNVQGVYNLLELVRAKDPSNRPKFLQISTDEVYGDILDGSNKETDMLHPSNPYASTKAAAEQLLFAWGRTYGLEYSICRSSNNYGFGQHAEKLIPRTIELTLQDKKMTVHGDGSYRREWTHVEDNCEAVLLVMEKGVDKEIYNISSGNMMTNLDIVKKILVQMKKPDDHFLFVENRIGQDVRYCISSDKIRKLGWSPKKKFEESLEEIVAYYIRSYGLQ